MGDYMREIEDFQNNIFMRERYKKKKEKQYELQYIIMSDGSQKHVTEFKDRSVDWDTYKSLRMNSYAQDLFFAKMDDNLLIKMAEYFRSQCKPYRYPAVTYDEAIIHVIMPELIKRFKGLREHLENM